MHNMASKSESQSDCYEVALLCDLVCRNSLFDCSFWRAKTLQAYFSYKAIIIALFPTGTFFLEDVNTCWVLNKSICISCKGVWLNYFFVEFAVELIFFVFCLLELETCVHVSRKA